MIMKDFFLILKYSMKNKTRPRKDKKENFINSGIIGVLFQYLFPALLFGAIIGPLFYFIFKDLNIPLNQLGVDTTFSFIDIIFSFNFLALSLLFFLNYSPSIIINLFDSEMTNLYLVMPVRRASIFMATAIDSLVQAAIPLGMVLPIVIVYSIIMKTNFVITIISIFIFILFLLAFSFLGGIFMSFIMGKTSAKRFTMLSYFGSVIFYVFAMNFFGPNRFNEENIEILVANIQNTVDFMLSPIWPHTMLINSINGDFLSLIILTLLTLGLMVLAVILSNRLDLIAASKKKKQKEVVLKNNKFPVIKKDMKLVFRDAQSIFMLIYPLILPFLLFLTGNQTMISVTIIFIMISAFYSSYLTVLMLAEDVKIWPMPKLYPVNFKQLINAKIYIPVSAFFLEYILLIFLSTFFIDFELSALLFAVPVLMLLYYSSLLGASFFLKNPKRDVKQKNILAGKEIIGLEFATMGFALIIYIPLALYIPYIDQGVFVFGNWPSYLIHLLSIGIPSFFSLLIIKFSFSELKKINNMLNEWE